MSAHDQLAIQAWIASELAIDGVLATGGGTGLDNSFNSSALAEMSAAADTRVWTSIAETLAQLQQNGAPTGEIVWTFESAVLCVVHRSDGPWLGVFTHPQLDDAAALALRTKLDAFKVQPFGN